MAFPAFLAYGPQVRSLADPGFGRLSGGSSPGYIGPYGPFRSQYGGIRIRNRARPYSYVRKTSLLV